MKHTITKYGHYWCVVTHCTEDDDIDNYVDYFETLLDAIRQWLSNYIR